MKVVVIDASWSCPECGRWIKPRTLMLTEGGGDLRLPAVLLAYCERDGMIREPEPCPYRVRIEEDAS